MIEETTIDVEQLVLKPVRSQPPMPPLDGESEMLVYRVTVNGVPRPLIFDRRDVGECLAVERELAERQRS